MRESKSPFSLFYWKEAAARLKSVRTLAVCAVLMALSIAIASVFIPLPNNLRVYFTFMPKAICAMICGPLAALVFGCAEDLLGFLIHPTGAFFIGYTLSSMFGMFLYALGFYRQRITVVRAAITKLAVNLLCNVALGALWSSMLYGKAYLVYFWSSLTKNLLLWPVETALILAVYRLLRDPIEKMRQMK